MTLPSVRRDAFGTLPDGTAVERVTLAGRDGFAVALVTYGAAVQSLRAPDRAGRLDDVVLGHDALDGYLAHRSFFGATVGRYANRIAGAAFRLDGHLHRLVANDGPNSLHGGADGFDRRVWTILATGAEPEPFCTLGLVSPDGDGGYPGRLAVRLTVRVIDGSGLGLDLSATTDRPTVVNLTHHGFFNLRGRTAPGDVYGHTLRVDASRILAVDPGLIPTEPMPVDGTPFDFRDATPIGARLRDPDAQILRAQGYDHAFLLDGGRTAAPREVARLADPVSGRVMRVETDQPALQVYSGNMLDASLAGKGGVPCRQGDAVCLEPQLWPNGPNRPDAPPSRLDPGETYRHRTVYRFGTDAT